LRYRSPALIRANCAEGVSTGTTRREPKPFGDAFTLRHHRHDPADVTGAGGHMMRLGAIGSVIATVFLVSFIVLYLRTHLISLVGEGARMTISHWI
jgi:hypothetical protein